MKTKLLMLLAGIASCVYSQQQQQVYRYQPLTVVTVHNPMTPLPILNHFASNYPGVTPYWGFEGKNYVARYIDGDNGLRHAVIYDKHGTILRVENEQKLEDCPAGLQDYYLKKYRDISIRVWSYEDGYGLMYYLQHGSRTVWFDRNGRHIRKLF